MAEQRQRLMEAERDEPTDRSIKEIVEAIRPQLQELTDKQVELAKMELAPVARRGGLAGGLLSVGGVFLHLFLVFISITGIYVLNEVAGLSIWASALIVSGILLVIGLVLAGAGANILRKLDPKPHHSIRTGRQNIEWIKEQFRS